MTNQVPESDTYTYEYGNNVFRDVEEKNIENDEDDMLNNVIKAEISVLRCPRVCRWEGSMIFKIMRGLRSIVLISLNELKKGSTTIMMTCWYILKMSSWRSTCEKDYIEDARRRRIDEVEGVGGTGSHERQKYCKSECEGRKNGTTIHNAFVISNWYNFSI